MKTKILSRMLVAATVVVAVGQLLNSTDVDAGLFGTRLLDQTGCCDRCPACDYVCNFDADQVEVEKTCFDVETKVICIPRVVFPWQKKKSCNSCDACDGQGCSSCVHNGARTRKVCVLKTDKYKCPKCEYTWSAEKKPCAAPAAGCCDNGCAAVPCDATPIYREPQSEGLQIIEVEGTQEVLPEPAQ